MKQDKNIARQQCAAVGHRRVRKQFEKVNRIAAEHNSYL